MGAVALTKFTQGANTDDAGRAVLGTLVAVDGNVFITNGDNTDVHSWEITMLESPTDSAVAETVLASAVSNTPLAQFPPDVAGGCYRVKVLVRDAAGVENVDYRCFGVPDEFGHVRPPYQGWPEPLPLPESGKPNAKPYELNFLGQNRGWMGNGSVKMLDWALKQIRPDYATQTFVQTQDSEFVILANSREVAETGFVLIAEAPFDLANYPVPAGKTRTVTFQAVLEVTDPVTPFPAQVRLYNYTAGAVVAGSLMSSSLAKEVKVSAALTLPAGVNLYEVHLRLDNTAGTPGANTRVLCKRASLLIAWADAP